MVISVKAFGQDVHDVMDKVSETFLKAGGIEAT
ncbi:hypothetical protein EVA_14480, partial [gut metagenome]